MTYFTRPGRSGDRESCGEAVSVLFRYSGKRYSDAADIIPLKWYNIYQTGGMIYVYDGKTGF